MTSQDTLPTNVNVPAWPDRLEPVTILLAYGYLNIQALGADDVFLEGTMTYRGKPYRVNMQHTDDQGQPKGYFYRDSHGQVYDILPEDGHSGSYARKTFFSPEAPKTYVEPLLAMVAKAVQEYFAEHQDHVKASRRATLQQRAHSAANLYNDIASKAVKALADYLALATALREGSGS